MWCCDLSDLPQQSAVVSQDKKEETVEEDIYEYDCPRPVVPPAPTRRTLSDISGPSAAFSTLSIDGAVEASTYLYKLLCIWRWNTIWPRFIDELCSDSDPYIMLFT